MDASPQSAVFSEFIGITQSTAALIERHRTSPDQTKNDILSNVLAHREPSCPANDFGDPATLDIGEGVRLFVGEKLHLYLSQQTKKARTPDAEGTVGDTAVMMDGTAYPKRHGFLNEMMKRVQARRKHVNNSGEIVSLSAFTEEASRAEWEPRWPRLCQAG